MAGGRDLGLYMIRQPGPGRWISLVWGVGMKGLPGNGVGRYPAAASRKRAQGVGRYPRSGDVSDRYMTVTRPLWAAC